MNQPELELQLKVWKELAISKQVLMRTATDALKLDPNCTQEQLKEALESVIQKIAKSETHVAQVQAEAKNTVAAIEKKLTASEKAQAAAAATIEQLRAAQEGMGRDIVAERTGTTREIQKLKERIAEQEKAMKAINTALSDTPENVLRKMNTLKKQKQEEAEARRAVESALNTMRADKRKQEQHTTEVLKDSAKLLQGYRDLHAACTTIHEQLKPLVADAKDLPALPEFDTKLVEGIEQATAKIEKSLDKK
ncbi:hypothetical protein [Steroidobacter denitrificans]|uniref:hypothetical protein n=1 Tax=Steroidobacter denitrificans TaxID=465721 RepID=UPI0012ED8A8A|nr:hypothetical protein [Steroidobacter denitrificans]